MSTSHKPYEYYNPNPVGKRTGDCVVRALCKALDSDWIDVYMGLCLDGIGVGDWGNTNSVWSAYLRKRGFEREVIPNTCPDCYTIEDFASDHPEGTYVVATGTHAVCVKDGTIYDTWNSSKEIPTYYFKEVQS